MQSTNFKIILFNLVGLTLVVPFFIVVTGSTISLPDSFYKVDGLAFPIGVLVLFLWKKNSATFYEIICLALVTIYILIGYLEGFQRHLLTIQFLYFFVVLYILKNLRDRDLFEINRAFVYSFMLFVLLHFFSIVLFSDGNYFAGTTKFFGFFIYQSHLTYPLVLSFGVAILCQYENLPWSIKLIFIFLAFCIIFLTLRRVGLFIYLFTLMLFVPWQGKLLFTILLAIFFTFSVDLPELIEKSDRLFNIFEGGKLTRSNAWSDAINVWNEPLASIIGNGQNNYAHNFFLQQLASHGTFIGALLIIFSLYVIFSSVYTHFNKLKKFFYIMVVVVVDFNLNSNLTQFYYSGVLALLLAAARREAYIGRKI